MATNASAEGRARNRRVEITVFAEGARLPQLLRALVVPVLGLLALSLIIWFLGPLLRLGNYEPLASATSRRVLIVLLFLV